MGIVLFKKNISFLDSGDSDDHFGTHDDQS